MALNGEDLSLPVMLLLAMTMTYLWTSQFIILTRRGENRFITVNYKGEKIVTAGGTVVLPSVLLPLIIYRVDPSCLAPGAFVTGLSALGLLDDLWGGREWKGFRGHVGLLWREKKVSTGLIKAAGGLTLSLLVAGGLGVIFSIDWLVKGIFLALSANLFNLLDTRPALAVKIFYPLSLILAFLGQGIPVLMFCWVSLYAYLPFEVSRKIMLGDTGAYLLGGLLGYFALLSISAPVLYSTLVLLLILHYVMEKYSLSKMLENNKIIPELIRLSSSICKKRGMADD